MRATRKGICLVCILVFLFPLSAILTPFCPLRIPSFICHPCEGEDPCFQSGLSLLKILKARVLAFARMTEEKQESSFLLSIFHMPSPTTDLIKGKLDIVDFIRGYVVLTPAGRNFKGLCPFHKEKSPSFMVSPERQSWHCFGCSTGGDIFSFAEKYENMDFGEALRFLAEKAGVELRRENPAEYRFSGLLFELNDIAKNFYRKHLAASPVAQEYLKNRGLTQQTIDAFEIGWAPNEPEALSMHLLNQQHSPQDLIQAGLSIKTERGMMLDRFRGRIMFPIHNHLGRVVGFTGRILPALDRGDMGKYINSPETPIFQKSKLMYGFWKTKDAIRELKSAVLVEGQMDFLMSWQSGVRNVIASSGTALTAEHLRALRRFADELILNFDGDTAGADAAERAIDLAESLDFAVKVAMIDGFKDAADAAQADPKNVERAIAVAMPAPEFYFRKYLPKDLAELKTHEGVVKLRGILGKLRTMASPVERDSWLKELAKRTGISERILEEEMRKMQDPVGFAARRADAPAVPTNPKREVSRPDLLAEEILAAALAADALPLIEDSAQFFSPPHREVFRVLASGERKSDDPVIDAMINVIIMRSSDDPARAGIDRLKTELKKEYYRERRKMLTQAIKNAEANGNFAELEAAIAEISALAEPEE